MKLTACAALGVIRILLSNDIRANLTGIFSDATEGYLAQGNKFVQASLGGKDKSEFDALKESFNALTGSELREFVADGHGFATAVLDVQSRLFRPV